MKNKHTLFERYAGQPERDAKSLAERAFDMLMRKVQENVDFDGGSNLGIRGMDGMDGLGVPPGGNIGEVLAKTGSGDNETGWVTGGAGGPHTHTHNDITDFDTAVNALIDAAGSNITHNDITDFDAAVNALIASASFASSNITDFNTAVDARVDAASFDSSNISDFQSAVNANLNVIANTLKVSNANHTGDATGSTSLTIQPAAITGKPAATVADDDLVLISDTSDSGNLKKVPASQLGSGGGGGGIPEAPADSDVYLRDGTGTTWDSFRGVLSKHLSAKPEGEPISAFVFGQSQCTGGNADAPTTPMPHNTSINVFTPGSSRILWNEYSYQAINPNDPLASDWLSDRPYSGMIKGGNGNVGYAFLNKMNELTGRDGYVHTTHMGLFGFSNWDPLLAPGWGDSQSTIDHTENLAWRALAAVPGSPSNFDVVIMMLADSDIINDERIATSIERFKGIRAHFISLGIISETTPWLIGGKFGGVDSAYEGNMFEYLDQMTPPWIRVVDTTGVPLNAVQPDVHYSGDGLIQIGEMMADIYYRGEFETQKPYVPSKVVMGKSDLRGVYSVDSPVGSPQVPSNGEINVELDGSNNIVSIQLSRTEFGKTTGPDWRYVQSGKQFYLSVNVGIWYRFTVDSVTEQETYFNIAVTQIGKGGTVIGAGQSATLYSEEVGLDLPYDPKAPDFLVSTDPTIPMYSTLAEGGPSASSSEFYLGAPNVGVAVSPAGAIYRSTGPASEGGVVQTVGDGIHINLFVRQFEVGEYCYVEGRIMGKCVSTNEMCVARFRTAGYIAPNGAFTVLNSSGTAFYEIPATGVDVALNLFSAGAGYFALTATLDAARAGETWEWTSFFRSYVLKDA